MVLRIYERASPNARSGRFGDTRLHQAISTLHADKVEALLALPAIKVDRENRFGSTPLAALIDRTRWLPVETPHAIWFREQTARIARALLAAGANPNRLDRYGTHLLAKTSNRPDLRDALLAAGADPCLGQTTPFLRALQMRDDAQAQWWWDRGARPNPEDPAQNPWPRLLPSLLDVSSGSPRLRFWPAATAWAWADRLVAAGHRPVGALLPLPPWENGEGALFDGADTPLVRACRTGHAEAVLQLLARGADPSEPACNGRWALAEWLHAAPPSSRWPIAERLWCSIPSNFTEPDGTRAHHPATAVLTTVCLDPDITRRNRGWAWLEPWLVRGFESVPCLGAALVDWARSVLRGSDGVEWSEALSRCQGRPGWLSAAARVRMALLDEAIAGAPLTVSTAKAWMGSGQDSWSAVALSRLCDKRLLAVNASAVESLLNAGAPVGGVSDAEHPAQSLLLALDRPGACAAWKALIRAGVSFDGPRAPGKECWLDWAACHGPLPALKALYHAGVRATSPALFVSAWPPERRALWSRWVLDETTEPAVSGRRRRL